MYWLRHATANARATTCRDRPSVIRRPPSSLLGAASEVAVVALAMNGDDAAFDELVRRRQEAIRNLFRRMTRDPALADDLAQQAFMLAWKSIRTLRSPSAFGAWLRKLAVNCWLQQARVKKHEVALDEAGVPEGPWVSTAAQRLDLDGALATLPPDARLCVVLAYSEGMSHAEISDSTAIPLGTVKSHIARGAKRLRELLHDYGDRHAE
jgi:RNA polymerase sigma factor (sigma-70 family)